MTENRLSVPLVRTYTGFAIIETTVVHDSLLDGNSGSSSVRIKTGAGNIWLDDEERQVDSKQDFTIHLSGESEHHLLAQALRDIADDLDRAPHISYEP